MAKYTRENRRFRCQGDDGKSYVLVEYQDVIDAGTYDNPHAKVLGLKSLTTDRGDAVNFLTDDTFQVVRTGVRLQKA
jgi:hypothetical protein